MKRKEQKDFEIAPRLKATVILLCYNQKGTVARALESVMRQQCSYPFEILIADDGSADGTREICEGYASRHPDKIRMLPKNANKGLVDNYFDAVREAKGQYIGDCAGDDEWGDESRLQQQIRYLDGNPDVSVVYTDVEYVDAETGKGELLSQRPEYFKWTHGRSAGREVVKGVLNHDRVLPYILSAALYRKAPVTKLLRDMPEMVYCPESKVEDVALIAALGSIGDAFYLPVTGYRYTVGGRSISQGLDFIGEFGFYARILKLVLKLSAYHGVDRRELKRFYKKKIVHIAAQARHAGSRKLMETVREIAREWGLGLPLKAKVHLWLLQFRLGINSGDKR